MSFTFTKYVCNGCGQTFLSDTSIYDECPICDCGELLPTEETIQMNRCLSCNKVISLQQIYCKICMEEKTKEYN